MKNKIQTETVPLPAHWASSLINGDNSGMESAEVKALDDWLEKNPHLAHCVDCSDYADIRVFDGLLTDCLDFVFHVQFCKAANL